MANSYYTCLNVTEAVLCMDLEEAAGILERKFPDVFIEPPRGIYVVGHTKPAIYDGVNYFEQVNTDNGIQFKPLVSIEDAEGAISDHNGNVVLTKSQLKAKRTILSNEPTVPAIAIEFIAKYLREYLNTTLQYPINRDSSSPDKFLKQPSEDIGLDDYALYEILKTEISMINDFQRYHNWNIYIFKLEGSQLFITRGMDWRILEYYRLIEKDDDNMDE